LDLAGEIETVGVNSGGENKDAEKHSENPGEKLIGAAAKRTRRTAGLWGGRFFGGHTLINF
jgi:hypothetical protein